MNIPPCVTLIDKWRGFDRYLAQQGMGGWSYCFSPIFIGRRRLNNSPCEQLQQMFLVWPFGDADIWNMLAKKRLRDLPGQGEM